MSQFSHACQQNVSRRAGSVRVQSCWHIPRLQMLPTTAHPLIPLSLGTATVARPFFSLNPEPPLHAIFHDILEIGLHRPMVRPLIVHKFIELFTRIVFTKTAERKASFLCACPEPTLRHVFVNIITLAPIAICCPARATKETTRTVLRLFHSISFPP